MACPPLFLQKHEMHTSLKALTSLDRVMKAACKVDAIKNSTFMEEEGGEKMTFLREAGSVSQGGAVIYTPAC